MNHGHVTPACRHSISSEKACADCRDEYKFNQLPAETKSSMYRCYLCNDYFEGWRGPYHNPPHCGVCKPEQADATKPSYLDRIEEKYSIVVDVEQNIDGPSCAKCYSAVHVYDGHEFNLSDICYHCTQRGYDELLQDVPELLKRLRLAISWLEENHQCGIEDFRNCAYCALASQLEADPEGEELYSWYCSKCSAEVSAKSRCKYCGKSESEKS